MNPTPLSSPHCFCSLYCSPSPLLPPRARTTRSLAKFTEDLPAGLASGLSSVSSLFIVISQVIAHTQRLSIAIPGAPRVLHPLFPACICIFSSASLLLGFSHTMPVYLGCCLSHSFGVNLSHSPPPFFFIIIISEERRGRIFHHWFTPQIATVSQSRAR